MDEIIDFDTVAKYNAFNNIETKHPLVSIVDFSKADPRHGGFKALFGFYTIFLKEVKCGDLAYGKNTYDYQEGTLVFLGPGQVLSAAYSEEAYQPKGWGLIFHSDLIHGTSLGRHIHEYSFFGYETREALHLSEREKSVVMESFAKIDDELDHGIDKHSKKLIIANIILFLDYCTRFYDRQFITRDNIHKGILERFENILAGYFNSDKPSTTGLPSVAYCAAELNLSANYFGDLVKKEAGKTAQEFIHAKIIDIAKGKIFDINKSVNQVAAEMGFKYPQHFARLFKKRVGVSPQEYRSLN